MPESRPPGSRPRLGAILLPILGVLVAVAILGGSFYFARVRATADLGGPLITPPPVLTAPTPNALAPVQFARPPEKEGATRYASTDISHIIPDNTRKGALSHILVPDHFVISSTRLVNLQVVHSDVGELVVRLLAPDMTVLTLVDHACAGAHNWTALTLDDAASTPLGTTCADNLSGEFRPAAGSALSAFKGLDAQGDWVLSVVDT